MDKENYTYLVIDALISNKEEMNRLISNNPLYTFDEKDEKQHNNSEVTCTLVNMFIRRLYEKIK